MSKQAGDTRQPSDSNDEHPPAYSAGPPSATTPAVATEDHQGLLLASSFSPSTLPTSTPTIDFSKYVIRSSTLSKDSTSRVFYPAHLCSDSVGLEKFIDSQLQLPPIPIIRITGRRSEGEGHEDFDLKLNVLPFILRGQDGRAWHHIKCLEKGELGFRGGSTESIVPSVEGGTKEWIQQFCADKSQHKSFTIRRTITGWDTEYIEGQLRMLLASKIGYTGQVKISFLLTHSVLTIHTPNPPGFLDHAASVIFSGKKREVQRYETVKSVWVYSTFVRAENGERKRISAVKSEAEWFSYWKQAIRLAICEKRKGWVSAEDRMDVLLRPDKGEMNVKFNEPAPYG